MDQQPDYEIYHHLIESTPDAVLLIKNSGEIVFINKSAVKLFGYSPEQLNGKMIEVLIPQRFHKQHQHHINTYHTNPFLRPMGSGLELWGLCKNGKEIPVTISLSPMPTTKGAFIAVFVRDLTDLEKQFVDRTAELHQTNQKLQEEIIERQRIETDLRQLTEKLEQRKELLTNELHSLEQLSDNSETSITASVLGLTPLEEAVPETFAGLIERYAELIDLALEEKAYKVDHQVSNTLRKLSRQLGFLNARPRDVVNLHTKALQQKFVDATYAKKQAYLEEGRMIVLQMMGFLVSYYRNHRFDTHYVPDTITSKALPENQSEKD